MTNIWGLRLYTRRAIQTLKSVLHNWDTDDNDENDVKEYNDGDDEKDDGKNDKDD